MSTEVGTFPDYQAIPYNVKAPARNTHEIMDNVRNTEWELKAGYVYEGVLPVAILFVAIGVLQIIVLPIWLYMYKRGKFNGCCNCIPHYAPSRRTIGICLGFILLLALTCILMAIGGAVKIHEGLSNASDETCHAALLLSIGEQVIHQHIIFHKSLARISQHNITARSDVNRELDRYL